MADRDELASRYLRALARLNGALGHDTRAQLGNLTLQVGLVEEILKNADPADAEARAKLERHAGKAVSAAREVHQAVERVLAATRSAEQSAATLDLRQILRDVEGLLAPMLRAPRAMRLAVPSEPVALDGDRDQIQRALLVVLLQAVEAVPPDGSLELRLDPEGVLTVAGSHPEDWLAAVSGVIEATGGAVERHDGRESVALRLPVQTRSR